MCAADCINIGVCVRLQSQQCLGGVGELLPDCFSNFVKMKPTLPCSPSPLNNPP